MWFRGSWVQLPSVTPRAIINQQLASVVQRLVYKFSKLGTRVRFSPLAPTKNVKNHKKLFKILILVIAPALVLIISYVALKCAITYFDTASGKPVISEDYLTIRYKGKSYVPYSGELSSNLDEESGIVASIKGNRSLLVRLFEPDFIREFIGVDCLHLDNGGGVKHRIYCVEGFKFSE